MNSKIKLLLLFMPIFYQMLKCVMGFENKYQKIELDMANYQNLRVPSVRVGEEFCAIGCSIEFDANKNCTGFVMVNATNCDYLFFERFPTKDETTQGSSLTSVWVRSELNNGDVMLFVGGEGIGQSLLDTVEVFTVEGSCTKTLLAPFPRLLFGIVLGIINNKIWACQGHTTIINIQMRCYQYNFFTATWDTVTTCLGFHNSKPGVTYKNLFYFLDSDLPPQIVDPVTYTCSNWIAGNSTYKMGEGMCSVQWKDSLIAIGGLQSTKTVLKYNFTTNDWTLLRPPPIALTWPGCVLMPTPNNDMVIVAAKTGAAIYDLNEDQWQVIASPNVLRDAGSLVEVNGHIYFMGGYTVNDFTPTDVIEEYNTFKNSWNQLTSKLTSAMSKSKPLVVPGILYGCY